MSFLDRALDPPSYGFERNGKLYVPTHREILKEFFGRLNIFRSRKNWLPFFGWMSTLSFAIPLTIFIVYFLSFKLFVLGFLYSMVCLGSHGTIWLHRYSTHRAFEFRNPLTRFICRNLVIKIIPDEIYVVSHHVHHRRSELPGDPYNVNAGWLYCFLADVNHQTLRKDLTEREYRTTCLLLDHTGVKMNTYAQYLKWGSICHPFYTVMHYVLSWTFWYGVFYLLGGTPLAVALFGMAGVWAVGVRTFNFEGHGAGKDKRREGIDFNRDDLSINQIWPGYVAGEWHNNHHLFPRSARNGFLPYQLDLPWIFIRFYSLIGGIKTYRDEKPKFMSDYYRPYLEGKSKSKAVIEVPVANKVRSPSEIQPTLSP